ncbi:MAG: WD40 repeat-like protein [Lentinula lateritia]|uniref:WD40-repeat-containing domain protein n=1 Tax=Lentinula lateritia TaxID=40482 RepID=A0ABQ8VLL2_9AGAR|nr:MAG: WD40 repeat-like protein [Lentinula lateritia]KAJ4495311.1 WD40-repeat-containing domain protein [Lentinula lateritia]
MRYRTLEIRWHESKPIASCDFQPVPSFKKARPPAPGSSDISIQEWTERWTGQSYKLATGGEDNHVRIWMVYPNIRPAPTSESSSSTSQTAPRPPRVEYLATLSRHSAAVNVVRWSPNGELIASAGDDGMIIIWAQSSTPQAATYGSDLTPEELLNEKEFWKVRVMVRCTTMQVYDLAWSPTGEYIIAGSTDNAARVFQAIDGKCIHEIADHTHFVQGVSWDPLNEFIATQSSDRAMHVHRVIHNNQSGGLEVHAVGKNSHMNMHLGSHVRQGRSHSRRKHGRTQSNVSNTSHAESGRESSRPRISRRESATSDAESVFEESILFSTSSSAFAEGNKDSKEFKDPAPLSLNLPLTPSTSVSSTPVQASSVSLSSATPALPPISTSTFSSNMFPPPATPIEKEKQTSSRRSSFSGASTAGGGPASPAFSVTSRFGRSPSPMPALPAIRTALPNYSHRSSSPWRSTDQWKNIGLYGDESFTNFFRRLSFSPDGALLVTPAGQFEDPEVVILPTPSSEEGGTPARGRTKRSEEPSGPGISADKSNSSSCVYIYTRANFARPPIATLPGHKKASVAVRFSPVLVDLRDGLSGRDETTGNESAPRTGVIGNELNEMNVDVVGALPSSSFSDRGMGITVLSNNQKERASSTQIVSPSPQPALGDASVRPPTPAASKPSTPIPYGLQTPILTATNVSSSTGSIFALPYRMLFAVVTMDAVVIYDTQQSTPVCMLSKLHYDEFTDASWSPDGQTLVLSSRDGYCTLVIFDEIFPAYQTQQQALQLQSIAHQHSVPITPGSLHIHAPSASSRAGTPSATPVFGNVGLPPMLPPSPAPSQSKRPSGSGPSLTTSSSQDSELLTSFTFPRQQQPGDPLKREREEAVSDSNESRDVGHAPERPKKKRRVALTRVGDVGS